jgi:hypothetical protein
MRLNTVSQIEPFGERQTHNQQRQPSRHVALNWVHLNRQPAHCPIKPNRIIGEAIAIIQGGCYE